MADKAQDKEQTEAEKADVAKQERAAKVREDALKKVEKDREDEPERIAKTTVEAVKLAVKPPEDLNQLGPLPDPTDGVLPSPEPPDSAPMYPVYEHPKSPHRGYEVLDLTGAYNTGHSDQVPGYFRVSLTSDPTVHQDVVTDAPYNRPHGENKLSEASEQLIAAAIDRLEALRKL